MLAGLLNAPFNRLSQAPRAGMPTFEEILCSHVDPDQLEQAKLEARGWLWNDPERNQSTAGVRELCVQHFKLLSQLLTHQFGFTKKQLHSPLQHFLRQSLRAFADHRTEAWMLLQMQIHVRITETNSIDFVRLPYKMQQLCKIFPARKKGLPVEDISSLQPAALHLHQHKVLSRREAGCLPSLHLQSHW